MKTDSEVIQDIEKRILVLDYPRITKNGTFCCKVIMRGKVTAFEKAVLTRALGARDFREKEQFTITPQWNHPVPENEPLVESWSSYYSFFYVIYSEPDSKERVYREYEWKWENVTIFDIVKK